ncbi:MAG: aldose epimerase family protein [Alphaproteobacteria bacterium]
MSATLFGRLSKGSEVTEVVLTGGDLTVSVLDWGAVIRDVRLAGVDHSLVLGFDRMQDYTVHSPYFGAIAGRCANRLRDGAFDIDGVSYKVSLNENETTHLHGGHLGFGRRLWQVVDSGPSHATLAISSPDGDEGYPGALEARVTYSIEGQGTLRMDAEAVADKPTLVNLAQHSYFNLDGGPDILDHEVQIHAREVTPGDALNIPTGTFQAVAGTDYDFTEPRAIRRQHDGLQVPYDVNYVISQAKTPAPQPVARLRGPEHGVTLTIASTEPGVQFYAGHKLAIPVPGLDGRRYGANAGVCFEPQYFPDAINHAAYASPILRPGERYTQTSLFKFARD